MILLLYGPVENGHLDVVKYLVSVGADIHANNDYAVRVASEMVIWMWLSIWYQ